MAIVPLDQVWVDANFKEPQLSRSDARRSAGQAHRRPLRRQGRGYHGKGVALGPGGYSLAFALLPAQNATGNWIGA